MRKIPIYFLLFAGLVTVHAHDMDAMKYFNLGISSSITSKKIKYFTEALKLNPGLEEAYEKRGLLYYFQEKYDKVIQDFERYVKLAPAKPDGYQMLGVGYLKNGIYKTAIFNLTRALEMNPHLASAYSNRAEAYRLSGNYERAISDSTTAINIWGTPRTMSDAFRTRAKAYLEIGKTTEAYADTREVMNLDPRIPRFMEKYPPIYPMSVMGLLILNAGLWFFVFELKLRPPKIHRFPSINILSSKLLAPWATETIVRERLDPLLAEIETLLVKLKGNHALIFGYLEENFYDSLTDMKKEFLVKTSILPRVNPEFCNQFLKISNSRDILKDLEGSHLFTSSLDKEDEWYTYHQLFRDFLQAKLITELGCQAVLELYKHAAELLGDFSANETALGYGLNAEAFPEVSCLLSKNEQALWDPLKLLPKPNNLMTKDAPSNDTKIITKAQVPTLNVYFFGKFRVLQEDREIPDKRWKSKKAQMLFKYLLYTRHKGYLKKDVFMELLWPEEDPVKTAKRFHVALASLRKTLEPEKARGIPSAYIARSGDAYRIDIGDEGSVDIENFREELKLARDEKNPEMAFQHYLKAVTIYQGDFLEEDLYIPWCDEEREILKGEYLRLLEGIIEYYDVNKDYNKCIDYAKRYLKVDKYAEDIYQLLMTYYSQIGKKNLVIKTFKKCKENITAELDCPLSKETEILYQKLISS
jgi:two-component SAPR family response regulator